MIIGICGKSGCGKSTLANLFICHYGNNCIHVDIDKIGHDVYKYKEVLCQVIHSFFKKIHVEI